MAPELNPSPTEDLSQAPEEQGVFPENPEKMGEKEEISEQKPLSTPEQPKPENEAEVKQGIEQIETTLEVPETAIVEENPVSSQELFSDAKASKVPLYEIVKGRANFTDKLDKQIN